ncbi:MAG: RloB domain-containing protein [Oscillospiraceae bacterium]|nr:RloB domain-containing protein [Oscillospiraceae bacterium]MBR3083446.1 RloB domain-containing protein [Oscillospiraceae bacterium]MBR6096125.1 RloB domain-containing protein [Oscillospiraceae bacterium]MBR7057032.1 RloB domain-containing protein [Oscillospiraceae bacterium]
MPRRGSGTRRAKKIVQVFCEGESEQAYAEFLKKTFSDVAVIASHRKTDLFDDTRSCFLKEKRFRDNVDVIDEVWFFFDVETKDISQWEHRLGVIRGIRKLRKRQQLRVRLLMTTGCIEYWLMLHYNNYCPASILTVAEKARVIEDLKEQEPTYKKGDLSSIFKIAEHYHRASEHAKENFRRLLDEGMPGLEDTDERNQWLCRNCFTFSTVFEAIEFLESLT